MKTEKIKKLSVAIWDGDLKYIEKKIDEENVDICSELLGLFFITDLFDTDIFNKAKILDFNETYYYYSDNEVYGSDTYRKSGYCFLYKGYHFLDFQEKTGVERLKWTPLQLACFANQDKIVKYLLGLGADKKKKDELGNKAKDIAKKRNAIKSLECFKKESSE
jgi:hypothetical protein